ncbi:hypothetical protein RND71_014274 [Anisodus tanguticus]|uniref:BHLH domain-containing protein n=1 Tax=Anisodus tanguticus TaxID=243964 RepID=A0AAE1SBB2_9SOLA|nr:hypothetical protein RND71_014274 [Anisodus tanguticus]
MGYLLKEVLKTLCGVNQWSYAVYWKIGCQNTKVLIWEESYCEPLTFSGIHGISGVENPELLFYDWEVFNSRLTNQAGERVHLLVNRMMMESQREGLVGQAAVTGSHQWFHSEGFSRVAHPPEAREELTHQFSAGIQTIAVVPVLPHGVVQFGSCSHIMENMSFVEDVRILISQLGCIPGVLLSDENATKDPTVNTGTPVYPGSSIFVDSCGTARVTNSVPVIASCSYQSNSTDATFQASNMTQIFVGSHGRQIHKKIVPEVKAHLSPDSQLINNVEKAEVISPSSNMWTSQQAPLHIPRPPFHQQSLNASSSSYIGNNLITSHISDERAPCSTSKSVQDEYVGQNALLENNKYEDSCIQSRSGDDLFDALGPDFKNKLLNGSHNSYQTNGPDSNKRDRVNDNSTSVISQYASSSVNQGKSDSGSFSVAGFERLLDSIASKPSAKQNLDDDVSCRTTLTNLSSSSAPNASFFSSQIQGEVFGKPKALAKSGATVSRLFRSECSKESTGAYSQSSLIYGSQISSWVEQGHETKPTSSVSTGYSKKPDETSKTGQKRLKPGENPRPRPKDRQMIQDRVKELREIIPNGAKCSIDALLERTIKHMLFLQSVTKHADKLKQTGESKIISKEGGLLLKDNYEGGATWAYEVGSQSMVCPIIVEDLNQPRQMLVEMLCEERGLFLEIADIIRGLGLTILKGVMETRNDKIWARFAVEANRDVTRMEIFISLVRLLEQTSKGGEESANATDNDTTMLQSFHQAALVSATGRPCN